MGRAPRGSDRLLRGALDGLLRGIEAEAVYHKGAWSSFFAEKIIEARAALEATAPSTPEPALDVGRPEVVVLCGSTRFYEEFQQANYDLTMAGKIVLSVGFYPHSKAEHGHGEGVGHDSAEKVALDELHKRKIDLADRVLVLNVGGYIGASTRGEIEYAEARGKPIDYKYAALTSEPRRGAMKEQATLDAVSVEFGCEMGRIQAEQEAVSVIAVIVLAAGGEVFVPDNLVRADARLTRSEDPVRGGTLYRAEPSR